jgi:hypothetical protein
VNRAPQAYYISDEDPGSEHQKSNRGLGVALVPAKRAESSHNAGQYRHRYIKMFGIKIRMYLFEQCGINGAVGLKHGTSVRVKTYRHYSMTRHKKLAQYLKNRILLAIRFDAHYNAVKSNVKDGF